MSFGARVCAGQRERDVDSVIGFCNWPRSSTLCSVREWPREKEKERKKKKAGRKS